MVPGSGSGATGGGGVGTGSGSSVSNTVASSVAAHFGNSFAGSSGAGASTASKLAAVVAAQQNSAGTGSSSSAPITSSAFDRYVLHSPTHRTYPVPTHPCDASLWSRVEFQRGVLDRSVDASWAVEEGTTIDGDLVGRGLDDNGQGNEEQEEDLTR